MQEQKLLTGDKVIWAVVILLALLSIVVVYSSTSFLAYQKHGGNTEYYLVKHTFTLAFGFILMFLTSKIKYNFFSRVSQIALIVSIPLLIYTLINGSNINNAQRWLELPIIKLTFQTSDFAKLALIAYTARLLSKKQNILNDFKNGFLPIIIPILVICALILRANLSTALLLFINCFVLLFCGGVPLKYLAGTVGSGLLIIIILIPIFMMFPKIMPRFETWKKRVETYVSKDKNEDDNYQANCSKIAISFGGFLGMGPGKSIQRNYLPQSSSDYIYAIIVEEYGSLTGSLIVLFYLILLYRGLKTAIKSKTLFATFLAYGISFSLVFQALLNISVAVGLFPVTGQTLPLLSMGGSSLWFTSISIGILLSISKEIETDKKSEHKAEEGLSYA